MRRTEQSKAEAPGPVRPPAVRPVTAGSQEEGALSALQRSAGNAAVVDILRRAQHGPACDHEGGHGQEDAAVQRSAASGGPGVQRSAVPGVLRSPGRPLDDRTRADMESRMGADFSDVRIHDNAAARASAAEVGARAYTSGHHVVLGRGGADPHTLAHELTHVIQQRQGPVAGTDNGSGLSVSDPSDRFERAAEANAARVMRAPVQRTEAAGEHGDAAQHGPEQHTHRYAADGMPVQRAPGDTIGAGIAQGVQPYATQLDELAAAIGTTRLNVLNALLDPAYDPMGAHGIAPEILDSNLKDPLEYASCFPTAHALFPVLTDPAAALPTEGPNPQQAADVPEFQAAVRTLTDALRHAWDHGVESVFRIEYAGHGFTLVIRKAGEGSAHVELIESLAHAAGILPSLERPGRDIAAVTQALTMMASANTADRVAGAQELGWNAQALYLGDPQPGEQEHFPQTRMKWWAQPLSPQAGGNWTASFIQRLNFVAQTYGTTQVT
ncbi:DUF4157 domain-containing protein [Streptomyces sp. NPDC012389]|uniref:eCIS core domain-containing protein n=1 Tax=unclassified Streptomyces TaxID=2593676 RepID=UPI001369E031|nr:DUF4157 domain-containing protein [Streptomyces sp. SID8374]MYX15691.1 DUF4157 domain-containing protein [Streptomyces sp. SID8374]